MPSLSVRPRNSVVLLTDRSVGEIPATLGDSAVAATPSCLAIACQSEVDGRTRIALQFTSDYSPAGDLDFAGELLTPTRMLSVLSVELEELLATPVACTQTSVRVFTNHPSEPDHVTIVIDE